ncbi:MAG: hypothetical protein KDI09_20560 [Halioglobus sp.]|nr:hypothetical protein [Halioglobus sp.]
MQILTVTANTPLVGVMPRPPGRSFLALPQLNYHFVLQPSCADNWLPAGLSLSIADSRLSIGSAAINASLPVIEVQLSVPAAQLAPIPLSGFCELPKEPLISKLPTASEPENSGNPAAEPAASSLVIEAALSAQAALTCASEDRRSTTYVSQLLDISLVCESGIADGVGQELQN